MRFRSHLKLTFGHSGAYCTIWCMVDFHFSTLKNAWKKFTRSYRRPRMSSSLRKRMCLPFWYLYWNPVWRRIINEDRLFKSCSIVQCVYFSVAASTESWYFSIDCLQLVLCISHPSSLISSATKILTFLEEFLFPHLCKYFNEQHRLLAGPHFTDECSVCYLGIAEKFYLDWLWNPPRSPTKGCTRFSKFNLYRCRILMAKNSFTRFS